MYKEVITLQKAIISTYRLIRNVQNHDANGSTYDASYELDHSYHCAAERETCKRLRTVIVLSIVGIGSLYGISNKITVVLCVYEYVIIVLRMLCTVHMHGKFQNIRFRIYTYVVYGVSDQLVKLLLESALRTGRYHNYHYSNERH